VLIGNERRFAYWLADAASVGSLDSAIGGRVMRDYARFEVLLAGAEAASGSPESQETVSSIPGGANQHG
jgi:hypothetical protein